MRIRKLSALVGAGIILGACVILYLMMDLTPFPHDYLENKWIHTDKKYKQKEEYEEVIDRNQKHSQKHVMKIYPYQSVYPKVYSGGKEEPVSAVNVTCNVQFQSIPNTTIQLLNMYKVLKFDNPDGGAWKQGWNIEYSVGQWHKRNKLKVFVVPHSHNDPGWIKTFEDYYKTQTSNILNNMVEKLTEDNRRKFIWAEISFFSMWWDKIDSVTREHVKMLLSNGQLEIVTGGWVMNDEANTHYFAILEQMIEGHTWLTNKLQYKPRNSWAIDPFGHTPTMAYLLKKMGLENLVIQRVHYSVKKDLALNKSLEFNWRQLWDGSGKTDFFTHMMPFYSYDIPHTCGPDPKICCQFDFRRLPGYGITCPWKHPPQPITEVNLERRAHMLLDQYRKKAQLYSTNVLLVPLGDDFRYDTSSEWHVQFNNYQKLFDYMNSNTDLHVQAQFGTLSDYFNALHAEQPSQHFPVLSGDFFTYADRDDHYWSGYYTSRPFYKRMDRVLIYYLRCAEILYGLAWSNKNDLSRSEWLLSSEAGLLKLLSDARRSLSLFQHHDGITGTAKNHVVEDYGKKMIDAINGLQHIMQQAVHFLLYSPSQAPYQPIDEPEYFDFDDKRKQHNSLSEKTVINLEGPEPKKVVFFNSLTWKRQEIVSLRVSSPYIKVTSHEGLTVSTQTSPVFSRPGEITQSVYDVTFIVYLEPLSLTTYFVYPSHPSESTGSNVLSTISLFNFDGHKPLIEGFDDIKSSSEGKEFSISNDVFKAYFNNNGFVKALTYKDDDRSVTVPVHIDFARYRARGTKETSGAYLFLPSGAADTLLLEKPSVQVIDGPLFAQVDVAFHFIHHTVKIYKTPGADSLGLEIHNTVDIAEQNNYELVMRVTSQISNGDEFYSDLNGLQMIKRKRFGKIPLQGNFYPLPSAAFIEDQEQRLTILTAQPVGFGSLKEGQIEVVQDRRLNQDDNRGLGQGVMDNVPTIMTFRLLLEKRFMNCRNVHEKHPSGLLSRHGHLSSLSLLHPIMRILPRSEAYLGNLELQFTPVRKGLDHDIHLVKLHTLITPPDVQGGLIFHRQPTDSCFPIINTEYSSSEGSVNINNLFPFHFGDTVSHTSLSFLHSGKTEARDNIIHLCPMDIAAFLLPR